jgi:hypothetical protein
VTRRYAFSGIWAADQGAANGAAFGDTEIRQLTKIMYGVGTGVPGPFPDTADFLAFGCWIGLKFARGHAKAPPLAMAEGL